MRTAARWGLPVAVTAAVVGGSFLVPSAASAVPDLAPTTAQGLLTDLAAAKPVPLAGTVVSTTDLGLPDLSALTGSSDDPTALTNLVSGSTTARVWTDGETKQRIAVLGKLSETDVVRSGTDVWTWRSGTATVAHSTLPTASAPSGSGHAVAPATPQLTPAAAAEQALAAVDPTTTVRLGATTTVAGRAARQLVLTPRDTASLVGRVVLAVDAENDQPLRVQVFARGASEPAISTGFTKVSFTTPSASEVSPALPRGSAVQEATPKARAGAGGTAAAPAQPPADAPRPTTVGTGWTTVLVLPAGSAALGGGPASTGPASSAGDSSAASLLQQASTPVSGSFGSGRLLSSSLFSALVVDDGRVLVGAVSGSALEAAAAS